MCVEEKKKEEKSGMGGPFISTQRVGAALYLICYCHSKFIFCLRVSGYESEVMMDIITVITTAYSAIKTTNRDKL